MANCPQINNTTIIGTSAVSYDSTPLPCTGVNTYDDLNTILTKFDNVICSAINSVNILSEEIMNITEDIMIITEEVENINNQIFICCPICDFTITATELPVCEFTATATELPVCDFTGSVNQVQICDFTGSVNKLPDPTTTTTSSSSTSTSTSTTTTTTTSACTCYELGSYHTSTPYIGNTEFDYIDCFTNEAASIIVLAETPINLCAKTGSVTKGAGDPGTIGPSESDCCELIECLCYTVTYVEPSGPVTGLTEFSYINCAGDTVYDAVGGEEFPPTFHNVCAQIDSITLTGGDDSAVWGESIVDCCFSSYPCVESDLLIINRTESTIAEIYSDPIGMTWLIGTPVGPLSSSDGGYNGTSGSIKIEISNYINGGCISMYINTVLIQSVPFSSNGTYTFDSSSLVNDDCLWFIINDVCP